MISDKFNRRKFLTTVTTGSAGGMLLNTAFPVFAAQADSKSDSEYLFADGLVYLNTGTLGPCRRETVDESMRMWLELESLPVKFYGKFGAEELAEKTRTTAARFLGCDLSEIAITNNTTSGMNAIAQGLRLKSGDRILASNHEHGGGLHGWQYLAKYCGVVIDMITIPPAENNADAIMHRIKDGIKKDTKVITVSHVFSSTGLRTPVAEISALARSKGILCIVDGAQAAGAIKVNVKELGCHAYATSGHKWLMGPKGTGLLYISKDARDLIRPMQFDASYNTYNDTNGTMNLASILGLGKAIEYLESVGIGKVEEHNLALRNRLYWKLKQLDSLKIVSPPAGPLASPMLACVLPEKIDRKLFVKMLLDKHKLSIRPTHDPFGFNGIRFSMHIFNTQKEVDFAAEAVRRELKT